MLLSKVQDAAERNERGMALMKQHKYRDAVEAFANAAKLDPSNALYPDNAGFANYKLRIRSRL